MGLAGGAFFALLGFVVLDVRGSSSSPSSELLSSLLSSLLLRAAGFRRAGVVDFFFGAGLVLSDSVVGIRGTFDGR